MLYTEGPHLFFVVDWQTDGDTDGKKQSLVNNKNASEFYHKLKANVEEFFSKPDVDVNQFNFVGYVPATADTYIERLNQLVRSIGQNKRNRLQLIAVLGIELRNLKSRSMTNKCRKCKPKIQTEMTNCKSCLKKNDIDAFYSFAESLTGYSRSSVTFYIRIASLCTEYSKLLYACVSTNDLKKYLKYVEKKMETEIIFWK